MLPFKLAKIARGLAGQLGSVSAMDLVLALAEVLPSGMYYSLFWHGAFAIHGYHSVPPWPASHGCVRIPMWLAPGLYSRWGLRTRVYVYYS